MEHRSRYKSTFFDREGPDGVNRLHAFRHAATVLGLSLPLFAVLGSKIGLSGIPLVLFTLVAAFTLSAAVAFMALKLADAAGRVATTVYLGGASTPYEEQFSHEQSLVMRRDFAGALALFEQRIGSTPNEPRVRIAAADLYATHGENPIRAAELYREVQRIPSVASGHDIYVSNRLADLYLGPLKQPGRALVEFRRLMQRYPGSTAASNARSALDNLKPDIIRGTP
jgi:hypothetical protein